MEYFEIYDNSGKPMNKQEKRETVHKLGLWHKVVHIWIYNKKGQILIQKRSKNKDAYPDLWDVSAAGHINPGENPIDASIREVYEELGIKIDRKSLYKIGSFFLSLKDEKNQIIDNEITIVFAFSWNGDIKDLKIDKSEVAKVKFIDLSKLEKILSDKNLRKQFVYFGNRYFQETFKKLRILINSSLNG